MEYSFKIKSNCLIIFSLKLRCYKKRTPISPKMVIDV